MKGKPAFSTTMKLTRDDLILKITAMNSVNKKTVNSEFSYDIPVVESDRIAPEKSLPSSIDNYF